MFNDIIKLVKTEKVVDDYGDTHDHETERVVFAKLESVGQREFYQAQAVGLKPELKFTIADYFDYQDEQIIRYKSSADIEWKEYTVLRTYRKGVNLEIVCKKGID